MTNQERAEPTVSARGPEQSDEFLLNRAYRCFGFLGIVTLPFPLLDLLSQFKAANSIVERWSGLAELAGMLLAFPVLAGMLYATIYGIRQTVRFRHRPLVFLSAVSMICGGGFLLSIPYWDSPRNAVREYLMALGFGFYIAANTLIPAWWFIKGRRQYRSKAALRD
jgi:hypothetical protein